LTEYLRGLVAEVEPLARRKDLDLRFEAPCGPTLVWCDLERLERVFVNLLSNATKFTPPGGTVRVSLTGDERAVWVQVTDSGPGFPPDKAARLFERFYQGDMAENRRYGGTGIGLALVKELVELHGGSISAQSAPGQGATFTVELLRDREHFDPKVIDRRAVRADMADGKRTSDRSVTEWNVALTQRLDFRLLDIAEATDRRVVTRDPDEHARSHTVLVVEDTPDVARVIHLVLRQDFRVMVAENGARGFEMAVRERPSLIITDLMMPEVDGLQMTRMLRHDPRTRLTPIVMLTARAAQHDRIEAIETGVNAYLSKPLSARELLSTARTLLNLQADQADQLLAQRVDSLQAITGGLAHEINNPLNYIKNSVLLLGRDVERALHLVAAARERPLTDDEVLALAKVEARSKKLLETAESGVKRIAATVELMGRYSRDGFARERQDHDLFEATRSVIEITLPAIGKDVAVSQSFDGSGLVSWVPEELNQVVSNLVQNAVEAVADGSGTVAVKGWVADGRVHLSVEDNGAGIPKDVLGRVFTPFFTTKGPGRGMGLGLTICWRVVKAAGGTIEVDSEVGRGTRFLVQMPQATARRSGSTAAALGDLAG